MGKTIFISSHILSELAELCDSVTIIDRGLIKYSGLMGDLLSHGHQNPALVLKLTGDTPETEEQIRALPGVLSADRMDGKPRYAITIDSELTDTSRLLRGVLDLGLMVAEFGEDKKHLNEAFMDLTEQGVRS